MALAVVSITHSTFLTDTTAHAVSMPATVAAGELLVAFIASDGSATVTTPAGWTLLYSTPQSTTARGSAYVKIALGTEGGTTVDFVTSAVEQMAAQVYRLTGAMAVLTHTVGTAVIGVAAGTTVDPPAVTAAWGASDNLFITCVANSGAQTLVSGPSGWGTPVTTNDGGGGQAAASASCYTSILASPNASENPGVFTFSATGAVNVANTIVIRSQVGSIGIPANTLAGATVNATTQALAIPAVAAGRILLITSHGRRPSTTLAPDNPTIADGSAAPLTWTPVFATPPVQIGVNPGTKAQWWWAISDGAAKSVTLTWLNASAIWASVADFAIGAGLTPNFVNQVWAANSGTPATVTATYPIAPTTGINFLSFYGAGGSTSTIATGYTSLTFVASTPYRTGYDLTPGVDAVMGGSFLDQILAAVNITDAAPAGPQGAKAKVWSGSAWVEKPMARWSGTAWVQEAPKVWSGTAWVSSAMPPWVPPVAGPTASLVLSHTPGSGRNDYTGEVGMRLGIGAADVPFSWVGIRYSGGNAGPYRVILYEWFSNAPMVTIDVDMTGKGLGDWVWTSVAPGTLLANGYYALVLKVTAGDGQTWSNPGATALKPVIANTYAIYRDVITAPGFANGTIDTQFVGLDLGW